MTFSRLFAQIGFFVALALPPLAPGGSLDPHQVSFQEMVVQAAAQPEVAAVPMALRQAELVPVSVSMAQEPALSQLASMRPPLPEPFAWVLAIGFLALVVLRRTRATHAF